MGVQVGDQARPGARTARLIDCFAVLWLLGWRSLRDVLAVSSGAPLLVWAGLVGLVLSGALLPPELSDGHTRVKLGLVLVLALNGIHVRLVQRRLQQSGADAPRPLLWRALVAGLVSQVGWWGAALIGFLNSQG